MDLDGDTEDDVDQIWYEMEPKSQVLKSSYPPTRTLAFLFLLTAGIGGLQSVFALIFSTGSVHLKNLGLSKPAQALVWTAGPVAGMTIQPYCGVCSDQCLSSWGRRRPFIAWGAIAVIISLIGLASAERVAIVFTHPCDSGCSSADAHSKDELVKMAAAYVTVFFIVALNIALQPLQGGLRALVADMCPHTQQPAVTAVAGIVISASNVLCYALGFVDLQRIPVLRALGGDSRFSILCILTSVTLAISVGLTCLSIRERSAVPGDDEFYTHSTAARGTRYTACAQLRYLCTSFSCLPRQVQQVFKVQFFSWIGWFPFLFYITTFTSETYKNETTAAQRLNKDFEARAARMGSLGLMLFALTALVAGTLLSIAHQGANRGKHFLSAFTRLLRNVRRLWIMSQILFAICMFATFFASSLIGVYILVGLCGISWAITIWAPYALINAQIVQDVRDSRSTRHSEPLLQQEEDSLIQNAQPHEMEGINKQEDDYDDRGKVDDACERRSGVILGLHNVAIAGPQIVAAASCSLIFWMLEGSLRDSVGWTLRAGGLAALGAAIVAGGI
ncbi:hypothetical protein TruAng_004331 [Truncatella angustata]|nr:hypothetical protein TruAng_004331 [Truncatella angustata]